MGSFGGRRTARPVRRQVAKPRTARRLWDQSGAGWSRLTQLGDDPILNAYLALDDGASGYVTAKGTKNGQERSFDQRTQMAKSRTAPLPSTWGELVAVLVGFVRQRRNDDHDA